jgi:hypothetical protein
MIATCSFSISLQASNENLTKTSSTGLMTAIITVLTPAPFVLGYSISKLQQARQFEKLRWSFETPHEANEILSRQARHLRKRGCIGLAVGAVLATPHIVSLKNAHDADKARQEIEKLENSQGVLCPPANNAVEDVVTEPAN